MPCGASACRTEVGLRRELKQRKSPVDPASYRSVRLGLDSTAGLPVKNVVSAFVSMALLLPPVYAFGHGGGLDSQGGHYDRKRGTYHYHRNVSPSASIATPSLRTEALVSTAVTNDHEVKEALIRQSISKYRGNCPCPYNVDRAGRRCGNRSAYSRPGGASPLCYARDVSPSLVEAYRERLGVTAADESLDGTSSDRTGNSKPMR